MEFQVKKDRVTALEQRLKNGGTGGGIKLHADFEPGTGVFKAVDEGVGGGCVGHIEGYDEATARFF
jgi:hypothetical protein